MSLNIDYTRVAVICLLDRVSVGLHTKMMKWGLEKHK